MNKAVAVCSLVLSGAAAAYGQGTAVMPPPPVLVIQREYVKPGKGAAHEKTESAFVSAMAAAKWPVHYIASTSMSGPSRALFFVGYPTFEAWEKDNHAFDKDAALTATLDKASAADGELLNSYDQSVFTLDSDVSLRPDEMVHAQYFEITQFHVKPGRREEFMAVAKIYRDAFEKISPIANWALYESAYGTDNGGLYLAISTTKSLSEDDAGMADGEKFVKAMGPDQMKKIAEMTALCVQSEQTNLFAISPKMSYASPDWVKADDFWKPKPKVALVKKAAAPAAAQ